MFNRPSWFNYTIIRISSNVVHVVGGWSAYKGTKTYCGRYTNSVDWRYAVQLSEAELAEHFPKGRFCTACLKKLGVENVR